MNIRDLDTFLQVVRHGNFATVAREQGVDPSSVSRTIAALEKELGTRLLSRNTRHLSLTESGTVFFERITPALEELSLARIEALDVTHEVRGRLKITVSNAFGVRRLSPILPAFCESYPALELDVLLTESQVDLIAERVDVAIRVGNLKDSSLVAVSLVPVRYHVVASPAWLAAQGKLPLEPADMRNIRCLSFALLGFRDHWQFRPTRGGDLVDIMVRPRLVATNVLLLRESALSGLGPTLLSDWMIEDDLQSGALVDLFPDWVATTPNSPNTAWAVYPNRTHVPKKVRVFIEFIRAAMSKDANV